LRIPVSQPTPDRSVRTHARENTKETARRNIESLLRLASAAVLLFGLGFPTLIAAQPSALGELREHAWAVLHQGLEHERAAHREAAVEALALMSQDHRAVRYALRSLGDKDFHVRAAAAASLGQLHASQARPALRNALADPEILVVLAAAHSLYLLKDKAAYDVYYALLMGDRKSSNSLLQSQLDRLKDPKQVVELGLREGIGFIPFGGMSYEAYRELRAHSGAPARAAAARFLATDADRISEDALVQTALADGNEIVRLAALDALAQRGDPGCRERLAKNLASAEKSAVRYRSAAVILHLSSLAQKHGES
jgi:HEAT repeat protein